VGVATMSVPGFGMPYALVLSNGQSRSDSFALASPLLVSLQERVSLKGMHNSSRRYSDIFALSGKRVSCEYGLKFSVSSGYSPGLTKKTTQI